MAVWTYPQGCEYNQGGHLSCMNTKLRYLIYCKKSSEDEDKQMLSIEAQIRELKDYAKTSGLQVIEVLFESKSAHKPGRVVFNQWLTESGLAMRMRLGLANKPLSP